ncbi:hypothetical protein D5S17_31125 [Pseudonocardiaceae bacterium YIM PH 21723]|nr:hypothetical protein D5S17_31125 [Pseudonocardiaceae bacterium YIM PH 21723]
MIRIRRDLLIAAAGLLLIAAAIVVGAELNARRVPIFAGAAPLFGDWLPHVGPGTVPAVLIAVLIVLFGQRLSSTMDWGRLLVAGYVSTVAWILALATVDGWQRGVAGRLSTKDEYLHEVPGVTDIPAMLRGFAARIPDFQPDSWTTHVSGHPPAALLVFLGLDRIGLGGGAAAAILVILVGALVTVAVPITIRELGSTDLARKAVPYLVLFPGAIWLGVSADGLFAGVVACGVAAFAAGAARDSWPWLLVSGLLLGSSLYLSYGMILAGAFPLAIAIHLRKFRPLLIAGFGVALVVAGFTVAGFAWWEGYDLVKLRYYQGIASDRPYAYWGWANLAAATLACGLAGLAGLGRLRKAPGALVWPVLAAVVAIVAADLSGLSKAEVERIWLPFTVWITASAALLPGRYWLAGQAVLALVVNHVVLTNW